MPNKLYKIAQKFICFACFFPALCFISVSASEPSKVDGSLSNKELKLCMEGIRELEQRNLIDGKVIIAKGNQIVFSAQNREMAEALKEPQFMIASISKQFFAAALLRAMYDHYPNLTEEKRIEQVKTLLAQPLCQLLPRESNIWNGHIPKWASIITPHHLLSHTSGLADYTEAEKYKEAVRSGKKFFELPHSKKALIELISDSPLLFTPGTAHSYSNTGYVLIAELIEAFSSLPASTYLQHTIFDPLNLISTCNPDQGCAKTLKQYPHLSCLALPWEYDRTNPKEGLYPFQCHENVSNTIGSGSMISTASDLLKWNLALHKDHSILPAGMYSMMVNPNIEGYGYGIGIAASCLGTVYRHRGFIDTYRSRLYYFPKEELSIIVLTFTNYDDEKLQKKKNKMISSLSNALEEEEKERLAAKKLDEKYPDTRGFDLIIKLIDSNLKVE